MYVQVRLILWEMMLCVCTQVMGIVRIAYFFTGVGDIFHENVDLLY